MQKRAGKPALSVTYLALSVRTNDNLNPAVLCFACLGIVRRDRLVFTAANRLVEAQRIEQRTRFDLELLDQIGFCKGIENYSRHMDQL